MSIIATVILLILLGWAGVVIRRNRKTDSDVLNARLEDVCRTSLDARIQAACDHAR